MRTQRTNRVGVREFRENLTSWLESKEPVAITRHGNTLGVYVPTRKNPSKETLEAIRAASEKMLEAIRAAGTTEEELIRDFERLHRRDARRRAGR